MPKEEANLKVADQEEDKEPEGRGLLGTS